MENGVNISTVLREHRYQLIVERPDGTITELDMVGAQRWATEVLTAVCVAEYDAAILAQMDAIDVDRHASALLIEGLRADRAEASPVSAVPGLELRGLVNGETGKPFIVLVMNGEMVGQWEAVDARTHALAVIEIAISTDLDAQYLRALTTTLELDFARATNVIGDLSKHRTT